MADFYIQWAGQVWNTTSCATLAPTCEEYVANNPKDFVNAYWAINTLQVFQDDDQGALNTTSSTGTINARNTVNKPNRSHVARSTGRTGSRVLPIYL